jgi:hypothetical protein
MNIQIQKEIIKKLPGFAKVYDEVYKDMETPTSTLSVPEK